ncbi:hypothetical protein D9758_006790 [Tetrapyrgos nigripes]|uniref:BTB domain-containing protein n=1 Tax=Tetrapyrgos nigripes TaxID=182062 RepID=A0A8H5CVH6_9AGAR|nr:hypothetical protein D9758_006790 [Tetrapyrgos nigripes]
MTPPTPAPYPNLSFNDGNLVLLAQNQYFIAHQGVLGRHSSSLDAALKALQDSPRLLQGRPVLELQESPEEVYYFLSALYDGISHLVYDVQTFNVISSLLRLFTKFEVHHLRKEIIRGLSTIWPPSLAQWDIREANATNSFGVYEPRQTIPHPILMINLARSINAPELLPSAFYDLSRNSPSQTMAGYFCPETEHVHQLSQDDLFNLLKGREHASRFLSTFLVNFLEGRLPCQDCVFKHQKDASLRRRCLAAFEAITFEILRDVNGVVCQRSSDPLFAIMDTELMQAKADSRQIINMRPCDFCRADYGPVVDAAREEFWNMLPEWFGIVVSNWG